jgi:hypothetical protein
MVSKSCSCQVHDVTRVIRHIWKRLKKLTRLSVEHDPWAYGLSAGMHRCEALNSTQDNCYGAEATKELHHFAAKPHYFWVYSEADPELFHFSFVARVAAKYRIKIMRLHNWLQHRNITAIFNIDSAQQRRNYDITSFQQHHLVGQQIIPAVNFLQCATETY